jgi:hypothetical protein
VSTTVDIIKLAPPSRGQLVKRQPGEPAHRHCNGCDRELTICSFSLKTRTPRLRRQTRCRECMAVASRRSYERNRDQVIARSKAARSGVDERNRLFIRELLADKLCADCSISAPDIFEFDHRHGDKRDSVGRMISQGLSLSTIEAEIAKCDILCPNCHRIRTHADTNSYLHRYTLGIALPCPSEPRTPTGAKSERQQRATEKARRRNRLDNIAYLLDHPCVDCSERDIRVLEYDHVRGTKQAELHYLISRGASRQRIEAERAKCEVRCCNCHRRRSHNARGALVAGA